MWFIQCCLLELINILNGFFYVLMLIFRKPWEGFVLLYVYFYEKGLMLGHQTFRLWSSDKPVELCMTMLALSQLEFRSCEPNQSRDVPILQ